jgi:integrase
LFRSLRRPADALSGRGPSTGERIVLVESVPIEKPGNKRSDCAAINAAEKIRTRLLAEADSLKVARTESTLGALLDRWLLQHEVDPTTRMNYESQIRITSNLTWATCRSCCSFGRRRSD